MAGAYAYFEWVPGDDDDPDDNGRVIHTPGPGSAQKFLINANTFPFGYETTSDRWENSLGRVGKNAVIGWPAAPKQRQRSEEPGRGRGQQRCIRDLSGREGLRAGVLRPDQSTADRTD